MDVAPNTSSVLSHNDMKITILDSDSSRVRQPDGVSTKLKPHQLSMINACMNLEKGQFLTLENNATNTTIKTRIGVIGDLVGSGKTLSILGLISQEKWLAKDREIFSTCGDGLINVKTTSKETPLDINIIIVPSTIMKQWENTIKTQTNIKYKTIYTKKDVVNYFKSFDDIIKRETEDTDETEVNIVDINFEHNIVLVCSNRFGDFTYNCLNYKYPLVFSRVIYDEIDSINLPNNKEIPASFYWFSTSTYDNLLYPTGRTLYYNEVGEYSPNGRWSSEYRYREYIDGFRNNGFVKNLFTQLRNNILFDVRKAIFLKNHPKFVHESFRLPKPIININICQNPYYARILNGLISNDVMECINAGDIQSAIEKFGCTKVSDTSNIIQIFTNDLEKNYKNKSLELQMKSQMEYSSPEIKKNIIDKLEKELAEIKSKIDSVSQRISNGDTCPICCDVIDNRVVTRCCGHSFCFECLTQALVKCTGDAKNACPMCRAKLTTDDIILESSDAIESAGSKEPIISKENVMKEIIDEIFSDPTKNNKLLIFSNYDNSFVSIQEHLLKRNINSSRISGTSNMIEKTVNQYKNGSHLDVLLLNSKFSGSGINLENTTHMVIYHNMTSELTQQIIGRAQRPGRSSPLTIYRLLHENEKASMSDISAIC